MKNSYKANSKIAVQTLIFFIGVLVFFWFLQKKSPWNLFSVAGILISAAIIIRESGSRKEIFRLFEFRQLSEISFYYIVIAILTGILWGIVFRDYLDINLLPDSITSFAITSICIGAAEETVFRGYIQRKLRLVNISISIVGASVFHTIYKCFIFLIIPPLYQTNFLLLIIWTLFGGCILGLLKELSKNTLVPVATHATFDLITYGDGVINAWWVWT